jgi:hypothetical protein
MGSEGPKGHNCSRADNLKLPKKKRLALLDLRRLRISIIRWTAFEDIADIDLVPFQPHGLNDLRQKLPRLSDERLSLQVFVTSGSFAHEDDARPGITDTENQVCPRPAQVTAEALPQFGSDSFEGFFRLFFCRSP